MWRIDYIERDVRGLLWYGVVFMCMSLEWWVVKEELDIVYANTIGTVLKCAGDSAFLLFPYWLLKPNWRWTALLPVWFFAIIGVVNLAYYRFWGDLIPPASIMMGGNVDGNLMEYGVALLRRCDLMMIAAPCLATIGLWIIKPWMSRPLSGGIKWTAVTLSLLAGASGQLSYLKTTYGWRNAISPTSIRKGITDHFLGVNNGQLMLYRYNGPLYYSVAFISDAVALLTETVELTEDQRVEISDFLTVYERRCPISSGNTADSAEESVALDSLNVVYIIVESLNAEMVGKSIGGVEIMPMLDSLAKREGSVVMDNVVSQIKASSSSDGHLLLMTGLLPPDKAAYSIMYGSSNTFPSLADIMPSHSKYLLLADDGVCWNEGNTLRNFGLGDPLSIKDRPEYPIEEYGRDGAMFRQGIEMMKSVKKPFFMTLMTISMHIPFKEEAWPLPAYLNEAPGLTQQERDYANMCMHTDRWIGEFLKNVPENTLVIIASDHHQEVASDESGCSRALYMAVNSGRTERISRTVGQVNLFPATLDILGVGKGYGGVAPSAFNKSVDGTMDSYGNLFGTLSQGALDTIGMAYRISDLIIRGDYFRESDLQARGR